VLIPITIGIIGTVFTVAVIALYRHMKARKNRTQTPLAHAIAQSSGEQTSIGSSEPVPTPELEMERLLDGIRDATQTLLSALAAEEAARAGSPALRDQGESEAQQIARMRVNSAKMQSEYYEAVERYRQFVGSLAPPLQVDAVQRGLEVMTLAPVLGNYVVTVPSVRGLRDQRNLVACH
jgi:hypothetical protein